MRLLALDLGSEAGWAWWADGDHAATTGVWKNKSNRYDGGGMRYLRFRMWLDEMHFLLKIDRVAFEEVRNHKGTDAAHVYGGLLAHLTAWCEQQVIPYEGIPVGTIKKHITGKGNSGKAEVLAAVASKLGYKLTNDNEADALSLLDFVLVRDNGRGVANLLPQVKTRRRVRVRQ